MNGSPVIRTDVSLRGDFASSAHNDNQKPGRKKRMPPLSIRLSPEERARLEFMAGNRPIGAFVKSRVFAANDNVPPKGYSRQESARILGLLARMDVFPALNGLLRAAGNGQVRLQPEMEAALSAAYGDLADIRRLLIAAQGIKSRLDHSATLSTSAEDRPIEKYLNAPDMKACFDTAACMDIPDLTVIPTPESIPKP